MRSKTNNSTDYRGGIDLIATHIEIVTTTGVIVVAPRSCVYLHADNEGANVEYTATVTSTQGYSEYTITADMFKELSYLLSHTDAN